MMAPPPAEPFPPSLEAPPDEADEDDPCRPLSDLPPLFLPPLLDLSPLPPFKLEPFVLARFLGRS